jgi:hypothetical protein
VKRVLAPCPFLVLGNDKQAGKFCEERLNTGAEFPSSLTGLLDGALLTQDYVLGYFQTSPSTSSGQALRD